MHDGEPESRDLSDGTVIGLDHVNVTTPQELEREVVDWYAEVLALPVVAKPEGTRPLGAWFRAGNQEIHVSVDPHNPPKTAHFALAVDELEPVVERLRAAGCHIEQATVIPGRHRCYTRDPAGNRIEIVCFDEQPAVVSYEEVEPA